MAITVVGLLLRMTAALAVVAIVVGVLSVHETAFMGSFFGVFIATLTLEVLVLHHRADRFTRDASSDASASASSETSPPRS